MKITFVSNYINHHQIPLSDKLYELTEGSYTFIQTEPMDEERKNMGWDEKSERKPYVKLFYEEREACEKLLLESECVIFGGCEDENVIKPRLDKGLFTIRYSERVYKEGRWKFISPRGLKTKYNDHTKYKKQDLFLLCAGAFVKGDYSLFRAYTGKMLKFGYFPKAIEYKDLNEKRKDNTKTEILWAARFIDWKHPEMMVKLANNLKKEKINAHITMVGIGPEFEKTVEKVKAKKLSDILSFAGKKNPCEVREMMRKADIFISTSDMKEGWGAVINESMNSGCVTIAGNKIGAVPYLICNGKNGFVFKDQSDKDLFKKVKLAIEDKANLENMGKQAYKTILGLWNADIAAKRLFEFIDDPTHKIPEYEDGPVSRA